MFETSPPPPLNPNVNDIADRAKHEYATGTQALAALHYRLGELAGTGKLDPAESMSLQDRVHQVWEALYFGTLCAVRDENTHDSTWAEADNTYSDGRPVIIQIRVEPEEQSDLVWEHNMFVLGDGAVNEHPLGTVSYIVPVDPHADHFPEPHPCGPSVDHEDLRRRLRELLDADAADDDDEK